MEALKGAVLEGAYPADLGRSLAYAAALRVARFGTANEHADWGRAHRDRLRPPRQSSLAPFAHAVILPAIPRTS